MNTECQNFRVRYALGLLLCMLSIGCRLPYPIPCFVKRAIEGPELRTIQGIELERESLAPAIQPKPKKASNSTNLGKPSNVDCPAPMPNDLVSSLNWQEEANQPLAVIPLSMPDASIDYPVQPASGISVHEAVEATLPNEPLKLAPDVPPTPLSLAEARVAALQGNLDLGVALVNPAIARQVVNSEAARFQAIFDSSYVRNRIDPPPGFDVGGLPGTTFDRIGATVTQPLTTGGSIGFTHAIDKADPHFVPFPNSVNTSAGISFRQPLLRGAGYQVTTAGIQIARTQSGIADAQSKLTAITVLSDVERTYWTAYATQKFLAIAQEQYKLADKQLKLSKKLLDAEFITKIDALQAETGLLIRQSSVIAAETRVRLAQRELKRIMQRSDVPVDSLERLQFTTDPNPLGLTFDRQNLAARAIDNRMELLQLRLQLISNGIEINVQNNSRLPRVDLIADLDALGLGSAYHSSLNSLETGEFGNRLGGLNVQMPIGPNYGALARLEQAKLRRKQIMIDQRRVGVAVTQQVYNAIDRVELSWEQFLAASASVELAQQAFDGESKIFAGGRSTSINVLITITNLGDAQSREVQAATDYQIAKVDLALAVGAMLGYGQVDWDPVQGATSTLPNG